MGPRPLLPGGCDPRSGRGRPPAAGAGVMNALLRLFVAVQASDLPPLGFNRILRDLLDYLSPYTEYVVILLVFWIFARRGGQKQGDFNRQAQEVLDELYK